jgi:hypothetical protein
MQLTGNQVNDTNILDYMKVIEERLVQIIAEFTKKMSQKGDSHVPNVPAIFLQPFNDKLEPPQLFRLPDSTQYDQSPVALCRRSPHVLMCGGGRAGTMMRT